MGSGTPSRKVATATRESDAQPLERVCSRLLVCRKNLTLYPHSHPRVAHSLAEIQEAISDYRQRMRSSFVIDTEAVLEEPDRRDDPAERRERLVLARILQLHLIERIGFLPDVEGDELLQLCFLLGEDFLTDPASAGEIEVEPERWRHIELSFYQPEDLPVGMTAGVNLLERAAGVRRLRTLESEFGSLAEGVRAPLRKALTSPRFLERAARLRAALRSRLPAEWESATGKVDLVAEALRAVVSPSEEEQVDALGVDDVLAKLERFLQFAETHVDLLGAEIDLHPTSDRTAAVRSQIVATQAIDSRLPSEAAAVQGMKQRLAFLFRTASEGDGTPKRNDAGAASPRPAPARRRDDEEDEQPHVVRRDDLVRSLKSLDGVVEQESTSEPNLLRIALDLLARDGHREAMVASWARIRHRLLALAGRRELLVDLVQDTAAFLSQHDVEVARDLLHHALFSVPKPGDLLAMLQNLVLPRGGREPVRRFFAHLASRNPRKAVSLLATLHQEASDDVRQLAEARLLEMADDPSLLAGWAIQDPGCLKRSTVVQTLERTPPDQLRAAFRDFFTRSSHEQAATFLSRLPLRVAGVEQIVFAAVDHGAKTTRAAALRHLARYPGERVTKALIDVVKLNNYSVTCCLDEVEAALEGLIALDSDATRAFLRRVTRHRRWLRHIFRREIRKTLSRLLSRGRSR